MQNLDNHFGNPLQQFDNIMKDANITQKTTVGKFTGLLNCGTPYRIVTKKEGSIVFGNLETLENNQWIYHSNVCETITESYSKALKNILIKAQSAWEFLGVKLITVSKIKAA